jgi:hypothetical protein
VIRLDSIDNGGKSSTGPSRQVSLNGKLGSSHLLMAREALLGSMRVQHFLKYDVRGNPVSASLSTALVRQRLRHLCRRQSVTFEMWVSVTGHSHDVLPLQLDIFDQLECISLHNV